MTLLIMKIKSIFCLLVVAFFMVSCRHHERKSYDEMGSNGLTTRTENLQTNLRTFMNKGVMIGQIYDSLKGIGWKDKSHHSNMFSICDDYAAVGGYELMGVEKGCKVNRDGERFDVIRKDILRLFKRGGLIILFWTAPDFNENEDMLDEYVKQLAKYLDSLQDGYGIKAPVVLCLYPLDGKSWYTQLSAGDYKSLCDKTIDKLKKAEVTNAIYGFSFSQMISREKINQYISDDIDVINYSLISKTKNVESYRKNFHEMLQVLTSVAQERYMVPGLTTGIEGIPDSVYFTGTILSAIQKYHLSYIMFGANYGDSKEGHYCVPYPGMNNAVISDFVKMYNDDKTIFLKHLNGLYLKY